MDGRQFVARLLQHVLPSGFKRIHHYGLLSLAAKGGRLALALRLLTMPAANPQARKDAQAFMRRVAPSTSPAARTARLGAGGCWSRWQPSAARSPPSVRRHAEGRRDLHALFHA